MALIPFEMNSQCPKCQGRGMTGRYCQHPHHPTPSITEEGEIPQGFEHLDLTCQWCGYTRFMMTADYTITPVHERRVS